MKTNLKDFIASIYSPSFYKNIDAKPLRSIFVYMIQVSITAAVITAIIVAFYMIANHIGSLPAVSSIFGLVATFLAVLMSMFVIWLLYGFVLGILIMLASMIFGKRLTYSVSIKAALYALSLGMIFTLASAINPVPYFGEMVFIVIILINSKGIFSASGK